MTSPTCHSESKELDHGQPPAFALTTLELAPFVGFLSTLPGFTSGGISVERFPNGELHVALEMPVAGADCVLVGSISPPDENLATFLLALHTLGKERARSVTAVLPYMAYARQDRDEPGHSLAASWTTRLLAAAGVQRIVTVDLHSEAARSLSAVPIESLSPASLYAAELRKLQIEEIVVVAPDEGGAARARELALAGGIDRPVVVFRKQRNAGGIVHLGYEGGLAPHAVVVDDILDTGATLISCCEQLRADGVEQVTIFVTHGLFTGHEWRELWNAGVTRIYTTDSVHGMGKLPAAIRLLSVRGLLAARLGAR